MNLIVNIFRLACFFYTLITSGLFFNILKLGFSRHNEKRNLNLENLGEKLSVLIPKLGPAFIKAAQFIATRQDIAGSIVSKKLEKLQDDVPQCPFEEIKNCIYSAIPRSQFEYIDEKAVAAASIAQIHKGKLITGEIVAIKVLRPGIRKKFMSNLNFIRFIANFLNRLCNLERLKIDEVLARVKKTSLLEMNLRMEAAAADKLKANLSDDNYVYVPKIFWQYTTDNIMVLEWIDGTPLYNKEALIQKGYNLHEIAKNLAISFFNQAYRDGFFHADMHQGNILIDENAKIVFLDFGIMGHLDYKNRMFMAHILKSFLERDYETVAHLHLKAGYFPQSESPVEFALACRSIGETIANRASKEVSISSMLKQLFDTAQHFKMEVQPQLLLLQKTMMTVEGISINLKEDSNIWLLIKPWVEKWAKSNLGIKGKIKEKIHNQQILLEEILSVIGAFKEIILEKKQSNS